MKIIVLISVISILLTKILFGQIYSHGNDSGLLIPQGFVIENLDYSGVNSTTLYSGLCISSNNPALISQIEQNSIGITYQFESKLKPAWSSNFMHERSNLNIPQSVAFIFGQSNFFKLAFGMNQKYNSFTGHGQVDESGYGTEDLSLLYSYSEISINSYSILSSISLKHIITQDDKLSFGVRIDQNILTCKTYIIDQNVLTYESYGSISSKNEEFSLGLAVGIIYNTNLYGLDLKYGLYYDKGEEFSDKEFIVPRTGFSKIYYPDKILTGIGIKPLNSMELNVESALVRWNGIDERWENQYEFSGNLIYQISNILFSSIGFYNTDRKFKNNWRGEYYYFDENMQAFFLTTGLSLELKKIILNTVYANSYWLSESHRKQSMFKIGIQYKI